jgi:hypothetical protein
MRKITRSQAISDLRASMLELADDDHCMCDIAAKRHVFCGGFSQWKFGELKERFDWIVKRRPRITRRKLEDLANRWQLARQFVMDCDLACDVQTKEKHHPICRGWDTFDEEDLGRFYAEFRDELVEVLPEAEREPA